MAESNELRARSNQTNNNNPNNTGSLNTSSKDPRMREEGELSSNADDENTHGKTPTREPNHISVGPTSEKNFKSGTILTNTPSNTYVQKTMPQIGPQSYRNSNTYRHPFKPASNRSLCWQKKPTEDPNNTNLVICFSDDDDDSDLEPSRKPSHNHPVKPKVSAATRMGAPTLVKNPNPNPSAVVKAVPVKANGNGESREKIRKVGPIDPANGRPVKRMKVDDVSKKDGDVSKKLTCKQNGEIVLGDNSSNGKKENGGGARLSVNEVREIVLAAENFNWMGLLPDLENGEIPTETGVRLQSLLELEESQDRELEKAQELRRQCEIEERDALKAYRKAQKTLIEANERCIALQRKRDLLSNQIQTLILDTSNAWALPPVPLLPDSKENHTKENHREKNSHSKSKSRSQDHNLREVEASLRSELLAKNFGKKREKDRKTKDGGRNISDSAVPSPALLNALRHIQCMTLQDLGLTEKGDWTAPVPQIEPQNDPFWALMKGGRETGEWDPQIDPLWPFCMFELRGRCNDEECKYQHFKRYDWRKCNPPSGIFDSLQALQVPAYRIGWYGIKNNWYLSHSVVSRSMWKYWELGFCSSFPLPFSIQRLLPSDAPFLRSGLSYYSSADFDRKKDLFSLGISEAEKSIEVALDISCEKKEAVKILARAIEREPNSVPLWVIYLHTLYLKERNLGKDDMFLHAVQNNKQSYELWLMYINSRPTLSQHLAAFNEALTTFCQLSPTLPDPQHQQIIKINSSYLLDLFLHSVNSLCMSGDLDKALSNFNSTPENLLNYLVLSDKCLFWVSCVYLSIYQKLPEEILERLELEKDLDFNINWPRVELRSEERERISNLFTSAFDKILLNNNSDDDDDDSSKMDRSYLKPIHFLAINHVNCVVAIEGLDRATDLLAKYRNLYPNCIEIAVISARLGEIKNSNNGFEQTLSSWPGETEGIQCIWNQYLEHTFQSKRFDLAKNLLEQWFQNYGKLPVNPSDDNNNNSGENEVFCLLNLSLYQLMEKKELNEATLTMGKSVNLAGDKYIYRHCLTDLAYLNFYKFSLTGNVLPGWVLLDFITTHLGEIQALAVRKPLSQKYYQSSKKTRAKELVSERLGPVADDCSIINSILETCHGCTLIPEKLGITEIVDLVESVMEITPSNYKLGFSVCRFVAKNFRSDDVTSAGIRIWASAILVNSVFRTVPVASESVWVETGKILKDLKFSEVCERFYEQATYVYPFSLKLWELYMEMSKINGKNGDIVIERARERGIEINNRA